MKKDKEIIAAVDAYLESMPDDVALSIIGMGTFSKSELKQHFERGTAVGDRFAEMAYTDAPRELTRLVGKAIGTFKPAASFQPPETCPDCIAGRAH